MFKMILGPCSIESTEATIRMALRINELLKKYEFDYYFKASFDKANRSSISSFRGIGIDKGVAVLRQIKELHNIKIITDVHEPWQIGIISSFVDIIQIPAFLVRQTDLVVEAAKSNTVINLKKAQFMSPNDMENVIRKVNSQGNDKILLTERGTFFGYNNLVVDFTSLIELRKFGYPVIFDVSHSLQLPSSEGKRSGGRSEYIKKMALAAVALGVDGLFIEVHEDPEKALSDGPNMLKFDELETLLNEVQVLINSLSFYEK
jgi:2-dehydro-3-deoxyphosphooctonate aldolase (KDO 8-P synthase)